MRLHEVDSHRDDAATMYGQAGNTSASMTKASSTTTEGPGKNAGEAGTAMVATAATGASMAAGTTFGTSVGLSAAKGGMAGGPWGSCRGCYCWFGIIHDELRRLR